MSQSTSSSNHNIKPTTSTTTTELDLTNATRGVWLVKVPKYISSRWENAKEQTEVGKLLISKGEDGTPEIKFNLSEELIKVSVDKPTITTSKVEPISTSKSSKSTTNRNKQNNTNDRTASNNSSDKFIAIGDPKPIQPKNSLIGVKKDIVLSNKVSEIPREHKFAISNVSHQKLAVFSEQFDDKQSNRRLVLEGNVVQKGECRPIADSLYMDLKKQRIVEARLPARLVKQLDKAVVNYKPMVTTRVETESKRKNEQKKSREDKDKVMDMLFTAFEKHQYYLLKDLEKITKQPISYLKDILKEIAFFNQKMPYKNMWSLKSEYAHYNKPNDDDDDQKMDT